MIKRFLSFNSIHRSSFNPAHVFDNNLIRKQKIIASTSPSLIDRGRNVDEYLRREVAERLIDKLYDLKAEYRKFNKILDFGSGAGYFNQLLDKDDIYRQDFNAEQMVRYDLDDAILKRDYGLNRYGGQSPDIEAVSGDMDGVRLPFENDEFDLIISSMALHRINDVPGTLKELNRVLKPNCPIIVSFAGNDSLYELRSSLILAELERTGLIGESRVSPMMKSSDLAGLMGKGGADFQLVTVDVDEICVLYPDVFELMWDLQAVGENNASINETKPLSRNQLLALDPIYRAVYGVQDEQDSNKIGLPATYSIVYGIGWKNGDLLPQPAERGSANRSIKEL